MRNALRSLSTVSAVAVVCLLGARNAEAADITITDLVDPNIQISVCDFEGGFSLNGTGMGSCGVGHGGIVSIPEASGLITFSGVWIDDGQATSGSHTVYFTEGPTNVISDILTYTYGRTDFPNRAQITGTFISDVDPGNLGVAPPGGQLWDEDNGPFQFSTAFLSAHATSDPAVPEPGTMLLLGSGLVGLARLRKTA